MSPSARSTRCFLLLPENFLEYPFGVAYSEALTALLEALRGTPGALMVSLSFTLRFGAQTFPRLVGLSFTGWAVLVGHPAEGNAVLGDRFQRVASLFGAGRVSRAPWRIHDCAPLRACDNDVRG